MIATARSMARCRGSPRALRDIDLTGQWDNPAESDRHIGWVRATCDKMGPLMEDRAYIQPHRWQMTLQIRSTPPTDLTTDVSAS